MTCSCKALASITSSFHPPPDDTKVENLLLGARPNIARYGVLVYRSQDAMFKAHCTACIKPIHSVSSWHPSCNIALSVRTTSRIIRAHAPLDQDELAATNRLLTLSAFSSAYITRSLKCEELSPTQIFSTLRTVPQDKRYSIIKAAVHASVGCSHTKLLRSSIITSMYLKPSSSCNPSVPRGLLSPNIKIVKM